MPQTTQETRLKPWVNEMDAQTKMRCDRAMKEKMTVISEDRAEGTFRVKGKTGEYEVKIGSTPTCTCPDHQQRQSLCIHMLYVYLRVLDMDKANPLVWQRALLKEEIKAILTKVEPKEEQLLEAKVASDSAEKAQEKSTDENGQKRTREEESIPEDHNRKRVCSE